MFFKEIIVFLNMEEPHAIHPFLGHPVFNWVFVTHHFYDGIFFNWRMLKQKFLEIFEINNCSS